MGLLFFDQIFGKKSLKMTGRLQSASGSSKAYKLLYFLHYNLTFCTSYMEVVVVKFFRKETQ